MDPGFRQLEHFAVELVYFHSQIARDFNVLLLVFPDRHHVAVVDQDIGGHQDRVTKQADGRGHAASQFVFIRMSAFQQSHGSDGGKNPGQLGHLRHIRLQKKRPALGVQPAGQKVDGHPATVFTQGLRVSHAGERMIIGDEIESLALGLEADGGAHHAEIVADVEDPAGLNAG